MTIRTMKCSCTFLVLLLSTSVFARQRSTAFVPKRSTVVSSLSSEQSPLSALDTTAFSEERDAQILAAHVSNLVVAATLCRGGGYDNYYDDRGYGGNDDDYYNDGNQGYEDNYYDDRDPSVCILHKRDTRNEWRRDLWHRDLLTIFDPLIAAWFLQFSFSTAVLISFFSIPYASNDLVRRHSRTKAEDLAPHPFPCPTLSNEETEKSGFPSWVSVARSRSWGQVCSSTKR